MMMAARSSPQRLIRSYCGGKLHGCTCMKDIDRHLNMNNDMVDEGYSVAFDNYHYSFRTSTRHDI